MKEFIKTYISNAESTKLRILNLYSEDGFSIDTYKISLLYSLINYLSTASIPNPPKPEKLNERDKFVTFVNQFCDFKEGNKVSLPQLKSGLLEVAQKDRNLKFIQEYINTAINSWTGKQYNSTGDRIIHPIMIAEDPEFSELTSKFHFNETNLKYYTHVHLLHSQRNSIIHGLTKKGLALDLLKIKMPYYEFQTVEIPTYYYKRESFELFYPLKFYVGLIDNALANLPAYFEKEDINPHLQYESSLIWNEK